MLGKLTAERLTAFFTGIIAITSVVALVYAHRELTQAREEAQVQHLMTFMAQFEQEPMVTDRRSYAEKKLKGVQDPPEEYDLLNFFDTIGLLAIRGYLNETDVWDSFSYWVFPIYADTRGTIEQDQKNDPNAYTNFLTLVERLKQIEVKHHGSTDRPSKEELREFWQGESGIVAGSPGKSHKHSPARSK